MPTVSSPMPSTRGRRPVATSRRSPRSSGPSSTLEDEVVAVAPRPGRAARRAPARCRRGAGPRRAPRPAAPARWRARARRRSTSTTSPPRRRTAWAISTPTGPPPRISRRRGTAVIAVTSRFVHTPSSSRRPGTGGTIGSAPVATTTCRAVCRVPSTSTAPGPASRPLPRSRSMPRSVSHFSALASVWFETMKSRHASAAATSTCALAAASFASWTASPGRSSVFDGMHAQ